MEKASTGGQWWRYMTDQNTFQAAQYHPDRNPEGGEKASVIDHVQDIPE